MLTVNEAINAHNEWQKNPGKYPKVDWSKVPLRGENLAGAILAGANLSGAILTRANLSGADLTGVVLRGADLSGTNLSWADLSGACFVNAYLSGANLSGVDLSGADLMGAVLTGAVLTGAKLPELKVKLPPKGESHIGYKKVRDNWILTLRIEPDSDRVCPVNGADGQCRASKVTVLSAEDKHGNPAPEGMGFRSLWDPDFQYRVGETKVESNYDGSMTEYMAAGIHYFTDKKIVLVLA